VETVNSATGVFRGGVKVWRSAELSLEIWITMETLNISMELRWLLGGVLIVYMLVMYGLALFAQRQIHNTEDYLVAGRRLPLSLAWMTLLATWFGAGTILAAADEVRDVGLQAAGLEPIGAGCCLLFAGMFIAAPMWREKLLTVPDLFRRRFGPAAEMLASVIMVPSFFGWVAAQFVALAGLLSLFFDIDPWIGMLLVAVLGTGYTLMGGMWSVTLTDAVQISLVLIGLVVLGVTVLIELGDGQLIAGAGRLIAETPADKRALIPLESAAAFWGWLNLFAIAALGNMTGQDLMQRIFAAKSERVATRACYIAGIVYIVFGAIPVLLGLSANLLLPADTKVRILPALAGVFLSPAVAVVFIVALVSAVLSTIDSAILAPASVLSQNVMSRWSRMPLLKLNRLAVLLVAACSLAMAYAGENAYTLLEDAYAITLTGLFVPMMFGLFTQPRSSLPALASMSVGIGLWLIHFVMGHVAGWEYFLDGIEAIGRWHLPSSLTATVLAALTYLIFEPPWRMRRHRPIQPPSTNTIEPCM
jgi:solute:Na+ symporter, SSS family